MEEAGAPKGAPVCPSCGKPLGDDIEQMDEQALLEVIHLCLLKDLARTIRGGSASHQELAIARGILRDNKKVVPPGDNDPDDQLPEYAGKSELPHREFSDYEHDE